jgi:hypothetical protein
MPTQEFPARGRVRTAPGPYPPGLSQFGLEGRKRRFLAYSFPSCSPGPHHLAVLARPGFVRAACHPPRRHPGRAALSSTSLPRQGRRRRSLTSTRIHSASRRTRRHLNTDHRAPPIPGQFSVAVESRDPACGRELRHVESGEVAEELSRPKWHSVTTYGSQTIRHVSFPSGAATFQRVSATAAQLSAVACWHTAAPCVRWTDASTSAVAAPIVMRTSLTRAFAD